MPAWPFIVFATVWLLASVNLNPIVAVRTYDEVRLAQLREEVKSMFYYAYDNYISNAYPYDELRPLSCDGVDTWGSYSLTLIDTLDTLAVIGNYSEFRRVAQLIIDNAQFDMNINVSVFETNIRIIGGLLSAHLLSHKAGMPVEQGWPCNGPLLRLAEKVARKLLPAFDTATGMPYGTVNLRFGVPRKETPITCTAGVGTFIVEFGALSRLTGDPLYEKVALRALHALYARRSKLDLFGNHIDTESGKWTAIDSGIGAGVDSFFEYLVKGAILLQKPELMRMFRVSFNAIEKYLAKSGWYIWATMQQGHMSATTFQSLESFWPGLLSLVGEFKIGLRTITNYHRIWKQYGGLPELYNIVHGKASHQREGYPLRPELVESAMYLYRATRNPFMLEIGEDILRSIERNAKTHCGFATIRDVTTLTLEDRMESFFLSETVKYLYLLFDSENFLHNEGDDYTTITNSLGRCTIYAGGYVFNTEAHPIDPSALHCCTGVTEAELHEEVAVIDEFRTSTKFEGRKPKPKIVSKKKRSQKQTDDSSPASNKTSNTTDTDTETEASKPTEDQDPETLSTSATATIKISSLEILKKLEKLVNDVSTNQQQCSSHTDGLESSSNSCRHINPLLLYKYSHKVTTKSIEGTVRDKTAALENLLKSLFEEEQKNLKPLGKGFGSGLNLEPKFVGYGPSEDDPITTKIDNDDSIAWIQTDGTINKELEIAEVKKLIQGLGKTNPTFVSNEILREKQKPTKPKNSKLSSEELKRSRIIQDDKDNPNLDLIFGTTPSGQSLSFYFSLKWLRKFPELITQLFPSETFNVQNFYLRILNKTTNERFARDFNLTESYFTDYDALKCSTVDFTDRFLFLRSTFDS